MRVAAGYARKHGLPAGQRVGRREAASRTFAELPSLLLVLIVIGGILLRSAETTAIVMFLIGTSMAMSWLMAYENVPGEMASFLPVASILFVSCAVGRPVSARSYGR